MSFQNPEEYGLGKQQHEYYRKNPEQPRMFQNRLKYAMGVLCWIILAESDIFRNMMEDSGLL
jgi:hypothetical protein